jgi:cell division protein ZapA (FtsZ GTPase activity inhibitor)
MIPLSKIIARAGMIVESKRIVVCLFLTDNKLGFMLALNFSDTLEAVCLFLTDNKLGFMLALNFSDTLEAVCVG